MNRTRKTDLLPLFEQTFVSRRLLVRILSRHGFFILPLPSRLTAELCNDVRLWDVHEELCRLLRKLDLGAHNRIEQR